jgi:curved DNA-binding protein CbpA
MATLKRMPFTIENLVVNSVDHIGTIDSVPAGQAPRGVYFQIDHYEDACWYTKNHYADPDLKRGAASISVTTYFGDWSEKAELEHLVFRIKRATKSAHFAALSFTLKLYVYSPGFTCVAAGNLPERIADRYLIRCIDVSADGSRIYYSYNGRLVYLDRSLKIVGTWESPPRQARIPERAPEYNIEALTILGLRGHPNNDDLRTAYRKRLFEVHPDKNPHDPLANEKTRAVISAFESLTSSKFRDGNMQFHDQIQMEFASIRFPAFRDEATATHIISDTNDMYIGCYSGQCYLIRNNEAHSFLHDCGSPIRAIKEVGRYLYLVSDEFFDVLMGGKCIARFTLADRFAKLRWGSKSGMEVSSRKLRLFDLDGSLLAQIESKDNIADAYLAGDRLKIVTAKKAYLFSVQSSSGDEYLANGDLPVLQGS